MRRVLAAAGCGLVGLALAGCGASQTAATAQDRPSVPGVNVSEAGISVRNAVVEYDPAGYPAGSAAPIRLALVNETDQPVRLVEVASPAGQLAITEAVAVGSLLQSEPAAPAPEEPAADDPAGQPPAEPEFTELLLAPGQFVNATLTLRGLTESLNGASIVPVELVFDDDTVMSLQLTLAPPLEPAPRGERIEGVYHH